jgi:hypothetical protein
MMDTKAANRIYAKRHLARRKRDQRLLSILAEKDWLDQLEVRGYLDPDRRGERARTQLVA